jgi:Flp pilus assembly protein TadD
MKKNMGTIDRTIRTVVALVIAALFFSRQISGTVAIAECRTAILLQPDAGAHADAHNNLGAALKGKGDWDGAISEFRTALSLQPDDAWAHFGLGLALEMKGDGFANDFRLIVV